MAPFPFPAHQTGRADCPHPAFRLASPQTHERASNWARRTCRTPSSPNTASLEKLLGELRSLEGVTRTVTNVVLSTAKENPAVDLNGGLAENSTYKRR